MSNQPLDQTEAEKLVESLDVQWAFVGGFQLERVFEFNDFAEALAFVNAVGTLAEAANHHPDIELSYGKVVVHLTSHDVGGLTQADIDLAQKIDGMK
jgi:4a-hydroxytetrahydrobiopterin dehydratase